MFCVVIKALMQPWQYAWRCRCGAERDPDIPGRGLHEYLGQGRNYLVG